MLSQDHNSLNNGFNNEYENRFQKIMYPVEENTIPKNRNYLETHDIHGASSGTIGLKFKKINGRDNMNIKDIPGAEPRQKFMAYKSNHNDPSLNVSDIVNKPSERLKHKYETMKNNPLEPQYLRFSDSRRHVHIYGEVEGSKPKVYFPPNTRRQTNMIEDIPGTRSKNAMIINRKNINFKELRPDIKLQTEINPITGEELKLKPNISFNSDYAEDK